MGNKAGKSILGYQNPKCYAKALCECSGGVDDEHYVSENALEIVAEKSTIHVENLGFQERGVLQEMGISSLTSRVLCMHHNQGLSRYDGEFGKMVSGLNAIEKAMGIADAPMEHTRAEGDLVERCMLKTLCGGLKSGNMLVPPGVKFREFEPPRLWLDILYKGAEFPPSSGLYLQQLKPGQHIETDKYQMKVGALATGADCIFGLYARLFGFRFALLMSEPPAEVKNDFEEALFRPEGILISGCNKQLIFNWKGGHQSDPLHLRFMEQRWVHED